MYKLVTGEQVEDLRFIKAKEPYSVTQYFYYGGDKVQLVKNGKTGEIDMIKMNGEEVEGWDL